MSGRVSRQRNQRQPVIQKRKSAKNSYKQTNNVKKKSFTLPKLRFISFSSLSSLKSLGVFLLYSVIGSILIVGVGLGAVWIHKTATSSEYFATSHVDIVGNVRLSQQMVRDLAKVHIGDNSLHINIAGIEQRLLKTPWVEEVSVKRILPDRFMITIKERIPSFWVKRQDVLYYADSKGKLIAPVETSNFIALPTLEVEAGQEDTVERLHVYLHDLQAGHLPVEFGAISALRLSAAKGIELYIDDKDMLLSIALDNWKKNLQRLSITIGDLARRKELSIVREIRATDGNVWVIKNV